MLHRHHWARRCCSISILWWNKSLQLVCLFFFFLTHTGVWVQARQFRVIFQDFSILGELCIWEVPARCHISHSPACSKLSTCPVWLNETSITHLWEQLRTLRKYTESHTHRAHTVTKLLQMGVWFPPENLKFQQMGSCKQKTLQTPGPWTWASRKAAEEPRLQGIPLVWRAETWAPWTGSRILFFAGDPAAGQWAAGLCEHLFRSLPISHFSELSQACQCLRSQPALLCPFPSRPGGQCPRSGPLDSF